MILNSLKILESNFNTNYHLERNGRYLMKQQERSHRANEIMEIGLVLLVLSLLPFLLQNLPFGLGNIPTYSGIIFIAVGIPVLIFGVVLKAKEKRLPPPPTTHTITKEKEVIKEVVMIQCKYCGGLMPQTATFCPNCGARREV